MFSINVNLICVFTSCLFFTNSISAFLYNKLALSYCYTQLAISSVLYHYYKTSALFYFDKFTIICIVNYGGYIMYYKWFIKRKNHYKILLFIHTCVFLITYLYYYGYLYNMYCFHPLYGNYYHAMVHILSSIGHHAILLL